MSTQLKNPPLVEALLEIKWDLLKKSPDVFEDPGYKIASGRLYDRINKRFGYLKNLPATIVPEELSAYTVRHQFRAEDNGWPLIQLGPGVATVNFTPPYSWSKFKEIVKYFIPKLVDSYKGVVPGQPDYNLRIISVLLRYINAVEFDWSANNTLEYISTNLHTSFSLPQAIIDGEEINGLPDSMNLQIGYPVSEPSGESVIRLATGNVGQSKGLIWELIFHSKGDNAPQLNVTDEFMNWLTQAHSVIEKWFFCLIDGSLHRQFKG